ncbi:MAG TPA: ABC transporter permease [Conexibacter sp.]|jgi:peptide/nickel transport system permease protein|nr:ABC transporter permease [Conexibacter sp.]
MTRYLLTRLAQGVAVVLGAVAISFLLVNAVGNPVDALGTGAQLTERAHRELIHQYGYDQPLPARFADYLSRLLRGDFGTSFRSEDSALALVLRALPNTFLLILVSVVLAWLIAAPVAIRSVLKRDSRSDRVVRNGLVVIQGVPDFWLALLLVIVFAVTLGWLPAIADGSPSAIVLPMCAIALPLVSTFVRMLRSQLLEVMTSDFVIAMSVRGLSMRKIVLRHVLPNALPPIVTFMALQLGWLLGGTLIVETVFGWPGIGDLAVTATTQTDLPVVEAAIVLTAAAYVLCNLLADLLVVALDPRIRVAGR